MRSAQSAPSAMEPRTRPPRRTALTLVEILILIGVLLVLIALLLPAISMSHPRSSSAQCQSQLVEIGMALKRANDARDFPVTSTSWTSDLTAYLDDNTSFFTCPADLEPVEAGSCGMNNRAHMMLTGDGGRIVLLDYNVGLGLAYPDVPAQITAVANSRDHQDDWPNSVAPRHRGHVNVLFFDGSVAARRPDEIDPRICQPFIDFWRPLRDRTRYQLAGCADFIAPDLGCPGPDPRGK